LNPGHAVVQIDAPVGRACWFLLLFCVFAWAVDFWSFVYFRISCMVSRGRGIPGASMDVKFESTVRSYAH
jgi:hypothetical protein